ncbi:protein kinase family protein [Archangium lipolyticum]|uniref:hypothetical protein n=1 Tax=Archangium lipolyticum TaxID=2970465 RepID=UPI00214A2806|nr:hypothetical protein [Archangium lipolyticum]
MPDLPPGTSINGAVVEELVKAGGYGTVYRARDLVSGTLLAIKFIPLYRAKEWAMRESIIARHFRHENLVQQVGFGYWPHVAYSGEVEHPFRPCGTVGASATLAGVHFAPFLARVKLSLLH